MSGRQLPLKTGGQRTGGIRETDLIDAKKKVTNEKKRTNKSVEQAERNDDYASSE